MQTTYKRKYFEHLNATRFVAFIAVFLTHCFYTNNIAIKQTWLFEFVQNHLKIGLLALDYFFVLSSFLISWIILEEVSYTNKFEALKFYARRTLRIFPLYFLVVIFGFVLVYISTNYFANLQLHKLPAFYNFAFFILNFYMVENGYNFLFFLTFFWSVSVEEQFYIFWALILKYAQKYATLVSVLLIATSIIFRATNLDDNNKLVFHTFSSLGNFGVGNLLCHFIFNKNKTLNSILQFDIKIKYIVYGLFVLAIVFYNQIFTTPTLIVFERLIFALFFAFFIADFTASYSPTFNLEKIKWMNYFGQLSFGLYCYHGIALLAIFKVAEYYHLTSNSLFVFVITPTVILAITMLLAHLSFKYFEKPILKIKESF